MADCVFCRIAARQAAADIVYEDDDVVAFRDIHPKYRVHILVVPKRHIASAAELRTEHDELSGKLLRVGADLAAKEGVTDSGFRLLTNTGPNSGQVVDHLHLHVLGGELLHPI